MAEKIRQKWCASFDSSALATKLQRITDKVKLAKEDYSQLRLEAIDLQEYLHAKLDLVTRYFGVLADKTRKLGGSSKTLMIANVCPEVSISSETIASLSFSSTLRNAVISHESQSTSQNLSDFGNDAHKRLYEKDKEVNDLNQKFMALKQALKEANDQCVLLFNEVQNAWIQCSESHKLRNQVAHLLQLEQEQKVQIHQRDSTIENLQAKLKSIESQLNEALQMRPIDSRSASQPTSKAQVDGPDSSVVRKREEELLKRDSIIEKKCRHDGTFSKVTEDAKNFDVGNKALATLFAHTPAGKLQRQIRIWLSENFEFLSVSPCDDASQLEFLATAVMDGCTSGLGVAMSASTDTLAHRLFEYSQRVYNSQLRHLKDSAETLVLEKAAGEEQVSKLLVSLESIDRRRRMILENMRIDTQLFTLGNGNSPIRSPSADEDARLASLISLDGMMKQVKDVTRQSLVDSMPRDKKIGLFTLLGELEDQTASFLGIDQPFAKKMIGDARRRVLFVPERHDSV